jgi:hypothetical protein
MDALKCEDYGRGIDIQNGSLLSKAGKYINVNVNSFWLKYCKILTILINFAGLNSY